MYAQTPATPEASPFSPLVYDALGATPKIQLRKAQKVDAAPAAQKVEAARSNAATNPRTPAPHAAAPAADTTH